MGSLDDAPPHDGNHPPAPSPPRDDRNDDSGDVFLPSSRKRQRDMLEVSLYKLSCS